MFRDKFQKDWLSIFFSCGAAPLELWDTHVESGFIRRVVDAEVNSLALEIAGTNVSTTYIYSPKDPKEELGICLPFLVMIIKNLKKYFTFEITILDDQRMHRRFRASNFQSVTSVRPFSTAMPIGLADGWNQVQFNLAEFTRRAYGTNYLETTKMQIHANCRLRRIYFSSRLYTPNDPNMPEELKMDFPMQKSGKKSDKKGESGSLKSGSKASTSKISGSTMGGREEYDVEGMEFISRAGSTLIGEEESRSLVTPEESGKPRLEFSIPLINDNETEEGTERNSESEDEVTEREQYETDEDENEDNNKEEKEDENKEDNEDGNEEENDTTSEIKTGIPEETSNNEEIPNDDQKENVEIKREIKEEESDEEEEDEQNKESSNQAE